MYQISFATISDLFFNSKFADCLFFNSKIADCIVLNLRTEKQYRGEVRREAENFLELYPEIRKQITPKELIDDFINRV